MKKIVLLILSALMLICSSCEKEAGKLKNSKWTFKFGVNNYAMEFTSKTDVRTYQCDNNYNFEDSLQEGTYVQDGNNITFGGEIDMLVGSGLFPTVYHVTSGVINGDTMQITATTENGYTKSHTLMRLKQ